MEWMKLKEVNGSWREDLKKNEVVQICYDKNYEDPLKLRCLNFSLGGYE